MTTARPTRFAPSVRLIHWAMAAVMIAVLITGFAMLRVEPGAMQNRLFDLHRSLGILAGALIVIRVVNRLRAGAVAPPDLPRWQVVTASSVQGLLYLSMLSMPLLGWAASNAFGAPVIVFGLGTLPMIVEKDEALSKLLLQIHSTIAWATAGLALLHIGAALHHRFIKRDQVFQRIWPPA